MRKNETFNCGMSITIQSAQVSRERERGDGVSNRAAAEKQSINVIYLSTRVPYWSQQLSNYLLVHYAGQLPRQVPVVGLHLIMILVLVLLYQTLVHCQCLAARVHELPADRKTRIKKQAGWAKGPKVAPGVANRCKPSMKSSVPEHLFKLFDLVVGKFLGTAVVEEGSGVSEGPGIDLRRHRGVFQAASRDFCFSSHSRFVPERWRCPAVWAAGGSCPPPWPSRGAAARPPWRSSRLWPPRWGSGRSGVGTWRLFASSRMGNSGWLKGSRPDKCWHINDTKAAATTRGQRGM